MACFIEINDSSDERLADYVQLRDVNLRRSLEAEHGLFIAEGAKIIRRAGEAGYQPRSFLLAPRWIDGLRDILDAVDVPVYVVSEALAEQITGFHVHRGALASMRRETRWQMADLMDADRLVVCEDIVDHTNVGAIIRCAAGLGWDGVLLAPELPTRCTDVPSRHRWGRSSRCRGPVWRTGGVVLTSLRSADSRWLPWPCRTMPSPCRSSSGSRLANHTGLPCSWEPRGRVCLRDGSIRPMSSSPSRWRVR